MPDCEFKAECEKETRGCIYRHGLGDDHQVTQAEVKKCWRHNFAKSIRQKVLEDVEEVLKTYNEVIKNDDFAREIMGEIHAVHNLREGGD